MNLSDWLFPIFAFAAAATSGGAAAADPQVEIKTNVGTIRLELYPDKAPITVENFLKYVREELDGNGGAEAFGKCFGLKSDEEWEGMEEDWRAYILGDLRKEALALSRR